MNFLCLVKSLILDCRVDIRCGTYFDMYYSLFVKKIIIRESLNYCIYHSLVMLHWQQLKYNNFLKDVVFMVLIDRFYNRSASFPFADIFQLANSEAHICHIISVNVNTDKVFWHFSCQSHRLPLKKTYKTHTNPSFLNLYKVQQKMVPKCFIQLLLSAFQIMKV